MVQSLHQIHTEVLSSSLVLSTILTGHETVDFELFMLQDVHHEPDHYPLKIFLETSEFCSMLSLLASGLDEVDGNMRVLKDMLNKKYSVEDVFTLIWSGEDSDLDSIIRFYCTSPAPGISQVEASITGKASVASLRSISTDVLDNLNLDITTPVGIIRTTAKK